MNTEFNEEKFIPKGAMAFFVVLVLLCAVIWYGIYFLMLTRN
jgi:cytochrome c oxidase subunit IIa family protein